MDFNFEEDAGLAATGNAAENLAALKRLASTMIRIDLGGSWDSKEKEASCMGRFLDFKTYVKNF